MVFSLHDPNDPLRQLDVLAEEPIPFEGLERHAKVTELSEVSVPIAAIDHLVPMKREADRPQDQLDITVPRHSQESG